MKQTLAGMALIGAVIVCAEIVFPESDHAAQPSRPMGGRLQIGAGTGFIDPIVFRHAQETACFGEIAIDMIGVIATVEAGQKVV